MVYRYAGSGLAQPVVLTERVVAQDGLRLEILVTAERGTEARSWIQVVTDTPENRRGDRVDALFLVEGDQRTELPNKDNADLYRLYEWVIPPRGGPLSDKTESRQRVDAGGQGYDAVCRSGRQRIEQREVEVRACDSEAFLWTRLRLTIEAVDNGEVIYRMNVVEAGRR